MKFKPGEQHDQGILVIDSLPSSKIDCDLGIKIGDDGRIWICVDGISVMRFKPSIKIKENKEN